MSNTRYAQPGSPLNQNRFASSPDIERGLLGNLVALKCAGIEAAEDRELLYWLQSISHKPGGLAGIATEALRRYLEQTPDAIANVQLTLAEEGTLALRCCPDSFEAMFNACEAERIQQQHLDNEREREFIRRNRWNNFTATFPDALAELCLDPAVGLGAGRGGWTSVYPELLKIVRDLKTELAMRAEKAFAHTELSRAVWSEILNAHQMGGAVLLHNSSANGKSFSASELCAVHSGRARYAMIPATNDATGFWRAIAESLGSASGQSFKCQQIRDRVIQTLSGGDLVLVLDNCQHLFPVSDYRYALPNRVNWVLELAEAGVPVVMLADSKLFDTLGFVEARTGWSRNKFVSEINIVELPAALAKEDVQAVAAAVLPDGEKAAQRKLADYMIVAQGYLHSGKSTAQRARRIVASQGRNRVTLADMEMALENWGRPAFKAKDDALKRADAAAARCKAKARNWRPDTEAQTTAKGKKRRNQIVTSSDLKQQPQSSPAGPLQGSGSVAADEQFNQLGDHRRAGNGSGGAGRAVTPADLETV